MLKGFLNFLKGLFGEAKTVVSKVTSAAGPGVVAVESEIKKVVHLWDDKRFFGVLWLALALILPFFIPGTDLQILGACAGLGIALFLGIPLGDSVPFVQGLQSLGLMDIFTNKANQGDPLRVFGFLFQVAAIVYVLTPLWVQGTQVVTQNFIFLGGVGVALSWSAVWGDHVAVQGSGS